jgi:succinate dehydrogenase / fumarate reductase, cytochrome b subunit
MAKAERPLSPHLEIYRWYPTMAISIAHRVTGVGLALGLLLLTWWLVALASGPESFATVYWLTTSWLGGLVLFGYTYVVFHHLVGGLRFLVMDLGWGYDIELARKVAYGVPAVAAALTILTWIVLLIVR